MNDQGENLTLYLNFFSKLNNLETQRNNDIAIKKITNMYLRKKRKLSSLEYLLSILL